MEAALQAFLITIAIVGGLLSPFLLFTILGIIGKTLSVMGQALINKSEEIKKSPPYDDVEVNVNPQTRVMTVRFIKNGVAIWQGSATRNEIEAAPADKGINFTGGDRT